MDLRHLLALVWGSEGSGINYALTFDVCTFTFDVKPLSLKLHVVRGVRAVLTRTSVSGFRI